MMDVRERRKVINFVALSFSVVAAFVGVFWLVFILADVVINGVAYITPSLFLKDPVPPGMGLGMGGLRPAFVGQFIITSIAVVIGIPIGLLGGVFLAEYGRDSGFARFISALSDIMMSVPTIVVGTFIYAVMVIPMGHFNGLSGSVALAIIMIPIVLRTTEDMLRLVPWRLREAAFALGAPYYKVILQIVFRGAATGIFTGTILSIARIAGETAPLLFTSFSNQFLTVNPVKGPMASLTVTIFNYTMGPYKSWHHLAWAASLVMTAFILLLTIIGKVIVKWRYKHER